MESFCNRKGITLVGSSRFKFAFQMVEAELVQQNNTLVYSLPVFSHAEGVVLTDEQIKMLKDQQKERIANSTCIYVVDFGGYIGDDTREEIAYAESLGLKIRYLSEEHPEFATSLKLSAIEPISHFTFGPSAREKIATLNTERQKVMKQILANASVNPTDIPETWVNPRLGQSTTADAAVSEIPIFREPTEKEAPKVTSFLSPVNDHPWFTDGLSGSTVKTTIVEFGKDVVVETNDKANSAEIPCISDNHPGNANACAPIRNAMELQTSDGVSAPNVTFTSEHSVTKFLSDWKAAIEAGRSVDYTGSIDIPHNLIPTDTAASEEQAFLHSVKRVDGQLTVSGNDLHEVQYAFDTLNAAYEDVVLEDRFHKLEGPTWADPKKRALATIEDLTTALGTQDYRLAVLIARDLHEHLSGCHIDTVNQ